MNILSKFWENRSERQKGAIITFCIFLAILCVGANVVKTFSNVNVVTGGNYRVNNTAVLDATTLGSGVVNSSLTGTGALSSGSIDCDGGYSITNIDNGEIKAGAAIDWTKISKTGSSFSDFTTRSAGDISSGTLAHERGGLEADVSGYTGFVRIAGGTTSAINNLDADTYSISNIDNGEIKAGAGIDAAKIADGTVSDTEYQYLANVTSDIQNQINEVQPYSTTFTTADLTDSSLVVNHQFGGQYGHTVNITDSSGVKMGEPDGITYTDTQNLTVNMASWHNAGLITGTWRANVIRASGSGSGGGSTTVTLAYGQAYRTSSYDITTVNTWTDLPLDGGNNNLVNVSHSTSVNPEQMTVTYSGVYRITTIVCFHRASAGHHVVSRVLIDGTTEATGSFGIGSPNETVDPNQHIQVASNAIVTIDAGSYIVLQVGTNSATGTEIDMYDGASLPDPTTRIYAILTIEKLDINN